MFRVRGCSIGYKIRCRAHYTSRAGPFNTMGFWRFSFHRPDWWLQRRRRDVDASYCALFSWRAHDGMGDIARTYLRNSERTPASYCCTFWFCLRAHRRTGQTFHFRWGWLANYDKSGSGYANVQWTKKKIQVLSTIKIIMPNACILRIACTLFAVL